MSEVVELFPGVRANVIRITRDDERDLAHRLESLALSLVAFASSPTRKRISGRICDLAAALVRDVDGDEPPRGAA